MTGSARPEVEIRPPLLARALSTAVAVLGIVLVIGPAFIHAVRDRNWSGALPPAGFLVLWLAVYWRTVGMVVRSTPDGRLVVRNQLRTTIYDRSQIHDVHRSAGGMLSPTQGALQLQLTDGTIQTLQVTSPNPFGRQRGEEQMEILRRWLKGS
jgi:hypothetical protein